MMPTGTNELLGLFCFSVLTLADISQEEHSTTPLNNTHLIVTHSMLVNQGLVVPLPSVQLIYRGFFIVSLLSVQKCCVNVTSVLDLDIGLIPLNCYFRKTTISFGTRKGQKFGKAGGYVATIRILEQHVRNIQIVFGGPVGMTSTAKAG